LDQTRSHHSWRLIYVSEQRQVPYTLYRVDLESQERRPNVTIGPTRELGLLWLAIMGPVFDPNGGYAYGYLKSLSQLFVVAEARW
jgi:hypothetical protein